MSQKIGIYDTCEQVYWRSLEPRQSNETMMIHKPAASALLIVVLSVICAVLPAHEGDVHADAETDSSGRVLGRISFPTTTTSPEAQEAFINGMLLLHLFEYPYARDQFLRAQALDPDYAMAYWGEAMTFNHPIWDEQDLAGGRAALLKLGRSAEARMARTPSPREQGFIAAVEVLYGAGAKAERDRAYLRAMERLASEFPEDHEVQLFYALSLLGVNAGVRNISTYMMSTALAQSVFSDNPKHPGAAHYLIHGVDDPVHAVLGLEAARALATMAPDAGHSQHMTSHIFTALGMWGDVVTANLAAVKVANEMRVERGQPARSWGHYHFWLLYGYLQQGRHKQARAMLDSAYAEAQAERKPPDDRMILDPDRSLVGSVVQMWARFIIETRGWDSEVADWTFRTGDAFDPNLNITYIKCLRAAYSARAGKSGEYLAQFQALKTELARLIEGQAEQAPTDLMYLDRLVVMELEMLSAIEMAKGETEQSIRFAREASRLEGEMPFAFGPPFIDLPSAEWLGEILLRARDYSDALTAFDTQLERSRQKTWSLLGKSQALEKLGNDAEARYVRDKLARIWQHADPGFENR